MEKSVPDDLKTVYRHPAPLMSLIPSCRGLRSVRAVITVVKGRGFEPDFLSLNPGSSAWLLCDFRRDPKPLLGLNSDLLKMNTAVNEGNVAYGIHIYFLMSVRGVWHSGNLKRSSKVSGH